MALMRKFGRPAWAWAFYDWANSAFATTVMGVFFPIMFKQFWAAGASASTSTFRLGVVNSAASIVVALLAPFLGVIGDRGGARKKFLFTFTLMGVVATGGLHLAAQGEWMLAGALYLFASIGFSGGLTFYDSLIVEVADAKKADMVSALGFSLGYLGGGLLFALNVLMVAKPGLFGLAGASEAVRWSFLTVALWWAVFAVPLFLLVPETKGEKEKLGLATLKKAASELGATLKHVGARKPVFTFLVAYWLYIDGVDTIIRMAVDFGMSLGFNTNSLMLAFLVTQFVGFPAAVAYGKLGERIGAKKAIYIGIGVYIVVVGWAFNMSKPWEFYALAAVVGLVQGGVQALSRSYFASLIPQERSAEYFGFYNMIGKTAAILGPLMMGVTAALFDSPRAAILPILALLIGGGYLLSKVHPQPDGGAA